MTLLIKKTQLIIFLFLVTTSAFSQIGVIPTSHDFGTVRPGEHYSFKVKLVNDFAKSITISSPVIKSNCASVSLQNDVLPPKGSTWLTILYNPTETENGPQYFRAVFNANFALKKGQTKSVEGDFQITAKVKPYFTIEPGILTASFANGQKPTGVEGRLELDEKACAGWKFLKADPNSDSFTVRVEPIATHLAYTVRLAIPEGLKPGLYQGEITIRGAGKRAAAVEYPYHVVINSLFDLEPKNLLLGSLDSKRLKNWKGQTEVARLDGKEFKIQEIEGLPSWLKYDIQKNSNGKSFLVHWGLDTGKLQDKQEQAKPLPKALILVTDSTLENEVLIPFNAIWPESAIPGLKSPPSWSVSPQNTPFLNKPISKETPSFIKK